jgi:hypothetical protein
MPVQNPAVGVSCAGTHLGAIARALTGSTGLRSYFGILAALILLLAMSTPSQSEEEGKSGDHQQNPATIQASTAIPAGVAAGAIALPTPKPEGENSSEEPWNCSDAFAPGTWSTWALVFVGGVAAWFAFRTLGAIEKQVEIGNQTLKETQNEFSARYRPRLRVRNVDLPKADEVATDSAQRLYPTEITFHVVNYGVSTASIIEARAFVQSGGPLPMKPGYERGKNFIEQIRNGSLASGQGCEIRVTGDNYPLLSVLQGNSPLWVIGFINYRGPLTSVLYRTAFFRSFHPNPRRRFLPEENPDYEYEE